MIWIVFLWLVFGRAMEMDSGMNDKIQFMDACQRNDVEWVTSFLSSKHRNEANSLVNTKLVSRTIESSWIAPMIIATIKDSVELLDCLYRFGASLYDLNYPEPLIMIAITGRCVDAAKWLVNKGVKINCRVVVRGVPTTPLLSAAQLGLKELVFFLLYKGAQPSDTGHTLIQILEIVDCYTGLTPEQSDLYFAVIGENMKRVLTILRDKDVDVDFSIYSNSPLLLSMSRRSTELFEALLNKIPDVNRIKNFGDPLGPVMYAIRHNLNEILELLVKSGADVSLSYHNEHWIYGFTALMSACKQHSEDTVKLLLDNGAGTTVNIIARHSKDLTSPLLCSLFHRRDANVSIMLLDNGADPNMPTLDGIPPLSYAIYKYEENCFYGIQRALKLLEMGADAFALFNYEYKSQSLRPYNVPLLKHLTDVAHLSTDLEVARIKVLEIQTEKAFEGLGLIWLALKPHDTSSIPYEFKDIFWAHFFPIFYQLLIQSAISDNQERLEGLQALDRNLIRKNEGLTYGFDDRSRRRKHI